MQVNQVNQRFESGRLTIKGNLTTTYIQTRRISSSSENNIVRILVLKTRDKAAKRGALLSLDVEFQFKGVEVISILMEPSLGQRNLCIGPKISGAQYSTGIKLRKRWNGAATREYPLPGGKIYVRSENGAESPLPGKSGLRLIW